MKELRLRSNEGLTNLNFLTNCTKFEKLTAQTLLNLVDVSAVSTLLNLKVFRVRSSGINSLVGFEKCTNLKEITISSCKVSDLSPLGNLEKLEKINVQYTEVVDLSTIYTLKTLRRIEISPGIPEDLIIKFKAATGANVKVRN